MIVQSGDDATHHSWETTNFVAMILTSVEAEASLAPCAMPVQSLQQCPTLCGTPSPRLELPSLPPSLPPSFTQEVEEGGKAIGIHFISLRRERERDRSIEWKK